jgi:hypothetical protein
MSVHVSPPPADRGDRSVARPPGPSLKLVLGGGLLVVVLGFVVLAVLSLPDQTALPAARAPLAQAQLPDGTLLFLEDVTFGDQHTLELEVPGWEHDFPRGRQSVGRSTSPSGLVVWLSRRDPQSGRYLEMDWWLRSLAYDGQEHAIEDDNAQLRVMHRNGSSSRSGARPFRSHTTAPQNLNQPPAAIIASSSLPRLRHNGKTFRLQIVNSDEKVVAEFQVPNPDPLVNAWPVWQPESLPATRQVDDLQITLNTLNADWRQPPSPADPRRLVLRPEFRVAQDGQTSAVWQVESSFLSDALGNQSSLWDCALSPHESAWKLTCRVFRKPDSELPQHQRATFKNLSLPPDNQMFRVARDVIIGEKKLHIQHVGGAGTVSWIERVQSYSNTSSSSGGEVGGSRYLIDKEQNGYELTHRITCQLPHLMLRAPELTPLDRLTLNAKNELGQTVACYGPQAIEEGRYGYFLEVADSRVVEITIGVSQGYEVDFLVAPPPEPAPAETTGS